MAKPEQGFFDLKGKVGNLIFSSRKGKEYVKGASARQHVQPEASRKSGKDFGTASSATALIRQGFRPFTQLYADDLFDDRLKSRAVKVIQSAPEALKGGRLFTDGDLALLKGMELNRHAAVVGLLQTELSVTTVPGDCMTITLPRKKIAAMLIPPEKALEAVIQFRCCLFYFPEKRGLFVMPDDLVIPLNKEMFPGGSFRLPLAGADNCVIMLVRAIHFTHERDGYMIRDRNYYAASIVEVVHIEDGQIKTFVPEVRTVAETPAVNTVPRVQWEMNEEDAEGD